MEKDKSATKPVVAITMGDPSGIGPEVVLDALTDREVRKSCLPLVIGDLGVLLRAGKRSRKTPKLDLWRNDRPIAENGHAIPVYPLSSLASSEARPGQPSKACGDAVYHYIKAAAELVQSGKAEAMATAPISKHILRLAGHVYPGHTELLAELGQVGECRMMLVGASLKVVLVTIHLPLTRVAGELSRRRIRLTIGLTQRALRTYFGVSRPRIAVTGLNPHAGEEGIFGKEEKEIILPAIVEAQKQGIRVRGPFSADSLFYQAAQGDYDAVVCMYHDQGLIPFKLLHFFGGVTLTLGLPFIRTSVDHGTAYDIAGKNQADSSSMKEAICLAATLARRLKKR